MCQLLLRAEELEDDVQCSMQGVCPVNQTLVQGVTVKHSWYLASLYVCGLMMLIIAGYTTILAPSKGPALQAATHSVFPHLDLCDGLVPRSVLMRNVPLQHDDIVLRAWSRSSTLMCGSCQRPLLWRVRIAARPCWCMTHTQRWMLLRARCKQNGLTPCCAWPR